MLLRSTADTTYFLVRSYHDESHSLCSVCIIACLCTKFFCKGFVRIQHHYRHTGLLLSASAAHAALRAAACCLLSSASGLLSLLQPTAQGALRTAQTKLSSI